MSSSQIAIVKEAENIIMSDLSKRFTAKEYGETPLEFRRLSGNTLNIGAE